MATKNAIGRDFARAKPAAKNTTAKPSIQKDVPIPISTQDRVTVLLEVFKDFGIGSKKSPEYTQEVLTATDLHWAVAIKNPLPHSALPNKEISTLKSAIKAAIKKHGSFDVLNGHNETPLHWALVNKLTDAAELLIENGANVNAMAAGGTPLHYMTASGNSNSTRLILHAGANSGLLNGKKKLAVSFIPVSMRKYFNDDVERAKVHIIKTGFEQGKLPSLNKAEMVDAIEAEMEYRKASLEYECNPNYYLQTNGVVTVRGVPTCSRCHETFSNDKSYARHMLSLEHILCGHETTYESIFEAWAYLTFKNEFLSVYRREKSVNAVLDQYPVNDGDDE